MKWRFQSTLIHDIRMRRPLGILILLVLLIGAVAAVGFALITPSNSRAWKTDHVRLPVASFTGDQVYIENIRDFRTHPGDSVEVAYYDKTFDLNKVESLWFILSIFNESSWRGPAHSMLSFGFEGGEYLVISVEARKEVGESYSPFRGMFKKYEIIYVVGDERDLVLTRAVHRTDQVYMYPIKASKEGIRGLFVDMLKTSTNLERRPEFYNTITNNCTTKLRDHVNAVVPELIPPSWKILLPGYSDELLRDLDLIESAPTIEVIRARYQVNDRARRFANFGDFSRRIRE